MLQLANSSFQYLYTVQQVQDHTDAGVIDAQVGTISANNDAMFGYLISEAMEKKDRTLAIICLSVILSCASTFSIFWANSEDWWACYLGWFILVLAIIGLEEIEAGKWVVQLLPEGPKIGKNWTSLAAIFPKGWATACSAVVIFVLAYLALILSNQKFINKWGIEYVIFALAFGLIISNLFTVPEVLKAGGRTEYFIKIGLVCMGADIFFGDIIRGGFIGLVQAVLVATSVWFMTYWISQTANAVWTLFITWILWSGTFFTPAILAD